MTFDSIPDLPMTFDRGLANGQRVEYKDRALGMFYMHPEIQGRESQDAGRPIYKSVPYVKIIQPGERDTVDRPVRPEDKRRFAPMWEQFENKQNQKIDGTPLSVLFPHNPGVVKNLDFLSITTVEQLAALQATQLQNIGLGAHEWHAMAVNFLGAADKSKGFQAMQSQLDHKDAEIARMTDLLSQMNARLSELENDSDTPRRGRKKEQE